MISLSLSPDGDALWRPAQRPVAYLVLCQALFVCASAIGLTLTGLVGAMLAPSRTLATLPYALVTVGTALSTVPLSLLMARWGRRRVFALGSAAGAAGGLVACWSIVQGHFAGFCAANLALGVFAASAQFYRFAAVEVAVQRVKVRAVGWVIGGGVLAALAGPALGAWAREAVPAVQFAGSYLVLAAAAGLTLAVLARIPAMAAPAATAMAAARTPLRVLLARREIWIAVVQCAVGASTMMFVMTATPLAILGCGMGVGVAAGVIQWHLFSMFAPGFFTGRLIARFGLRRVLLAGAALIAAGAAVALGGSSRWHFGMALALNGLGWNFMFVGGSTLLATTTGAWPPGERARAQAASEFITAVVVALAALLSGWVFERAGWASVNLLAWPALALAAACALALKPAREAGPLPR